MVQPAVPLYVSNHGQQVFRECPPGHKFNLYLPVWNDQWHLDKTEGAKSEAAGESLSLGSAATALNAIRQRQQKIAEALPVGCCAVIDAVSTSPFSTGLGLDHPIENGFAFLSPYGLPYLAGSGVKGVMRRAAEELFGESDSLVRALFGPEEIRQPEDAHRGALSFWDVFPKPPNGEMVVEIMTPHDKDRNYYHPEHGRERYATPHDSGKPNPIPFLAVPAGAKFRFVVLCEPALLPKGLAADWQVQVREIAQHAFDWLGFGAKTAVGYGAMRIANEEDLLADKKASLHCDWVDQAIGDIAKKNKIPDIKLGDVLRGKALAEAWRALTDAKLKQSALGDIRARWQEHGWWDNPPPGVAQRALAIYRENSLDLGKAP